MGKSENEAIDSIVDQVDDVAEEGLSVSYIQEALLEVLGIRDN